MNKSIRSAAIAAILIGCGGAREECVDSSACGPVSEVVAAGRCEEEFGPDFEPRVCADGTGAECSELEVFGTGAVCSGATVECCRTP